MSRFKPGDVVTRIESDGTLMTIEKPQKVKIDWGRQVDLISGYVCFWFEEDRRIRSWFPEQSLLGVPEGLLKGYNDVKFTGEDHGENYIEGIKPWEPEDE